MPTKEESLTWRGHDLVDRDGDKIGKIEEIYLDTDTDAPEWALVNTGLFGTKSTFVPLRGATPAGDGVQVPFEKAQVKDAPGIDAGGDLSQREEAELYRHYGLDYGEARSDSGLPEGGAGTGTAGYDRDADLADRDRDRDFDRDRGLDAGRGTVGRDTSGPTTDDAMTISEEELNVGTTRREAGRARLRKYVFTEDVQTTVPVEREEVRVEREPITDANIDRATEGPDISEEEHEVVLHAEEPVVEKRTVPKERVRLDTETVQEERSVSDTVRREEVDVEGARDRR
jgi:uncharacterized protein (TIGR02271 family)